MFKHNSSMILLIFCFLTVDLHATTCPDPQTTSLQWGKVPSPWLVSPFSDHTPQGDKSTRFVQVNLLVAGVGRGVVCNYRNSLGLYSIWWPVNVSIPARSDYNWRVSLSGFECTTSLEACVFHTGL